MPCFGRYSGRGFQTNDQRLTSDQRPELPFDNITLHGIHPYTFRSRPLQRALDLADLAFDFEHHPSAIFRDVRPPDVRHDLELLAQLVDDRHRDQLLRECEFHSLLCHLSLPGGDIYNAAATSAVACVTLWRSPSADSNAAIVGAMCSGSSSASSIASCVFSPEP